MRSYASIDRIEDEYVVCEVELVCLENSRAEDFAIKDTQMMDVPSKALEVLVGDFEETDILVVEHVDDKIVWVYYKDEEEKERRIELLKKITKE